jgi:dUTP pyrophosphatase
MKIKIKRFDKQLELPKHQSKQAAAFDLSARERVEVAPHQICYVPLNIAVETPVGHFLLLAARSSLHKKGLMLANGIGIVDPDFSGDQDEIKAALLNFTDQAVVLEKGDRIIQGIFVDTKPYEWGEVEKLENENRGGFGSTGQK